MQYWMLVGTPENWDIMQKNGSNLCAMKARRKNYAQQVKPGDKVVFYLTKVQSFAGAAEFSSTFTEDHSKLFVSENKEPHSAKATRGEEDYPWRFKIKPEVMLPKEKSIPAETLKDKLQYVQKWPAQHWKLAFQGNVHVILEADYHKIKEALRNK